MEEIAREEEILRLKAVEIQEKKALEREQKEKEVVEVNTVDADAPDSNLRNFNEIDIVADLERDEKGNLIVQLGTNHDIRCIDPMNKIINLLSSVNIPANKVKVMLHSRKRTHLLWSCCLDLI